mgnify:FL=1
MVRRVLLISLALFGVLLGAAFMTPDRWHVDVSVDIDASPEVVWSWVAQEERCAAWMPWNRPGQSEFTGLTLDVQEPGAKVVMTGTLAERFHSVGFLATGLEGDRVRVVWALGGELGWDPALRLFRPIIEDEIRDELALGLEELKQKAESSGKNDPHGDAPVGTLAPH